MKRLVLAATLAAAAAFGGPANADVCAGNVLCAVSGCYGTVNVCPTAESCSGGVSVCPMAHPRDCHSSVDVCLNLIGPVLDCGPALYQVCKLVPR